MSNEQSELEALQQVLADKEIDLAKLACLLSQRGRSLQVRNILPDGVRDGDCSHCIRATLAHALESNLIIRHIDFSSTHIGLGSADGSAASSVSDVVASLALMIQKNTALTEIDLSGNCLNESEMLLLISAFRDNASIHTIDLAGNHLTEIGLKAIGTWLQHSNLITSVNLSLGNSDLGVDVVLDVLTSVLQQNNSITSLGVIRFDHDATRMQGKACRSAFAEFAQAVEHSTSITNIRFCDDFETEEHDFQEPVAAIRAACKVRLDRYSASISHSIKLCPFVWYSEIAHVCRVRRAKFIGIRSKIGMAAAPSIQQR